MHELRQTVDALAGHAASTSLVSIGRVGKPVAKDHDAFRKRRANTLGQKLGAGSEHEQKFGQLVDRLIRSMQQ